MTPAQDALRKYLRVLDEGVRSPELNDAAKQFMDAALAASTAERDAFLDELQKVIGSYEIERAGHAAIVAGSLVDGGGSPEIALDAVLTRLAETLPNAQKFEEAFNQKLDESDGEEEGLEQANELPEVIPDVNAFRWLPMSAISMLSRSAELRKRARALPKLWEDFERVKPDHFILALLKVLDDEPLLVLYPDSLQGFRIRIGGIADNSQLLILMMDALAGPGMFPGSRPPRDMVLNAQGEGAQETAYTTVAAWHLCTWHALRTDGALEKNLPMAPPEMSVWPNGSPSDIPAFEGIRTVLLAPPAYKRILNGSRMFAHLKAYLKITEGVPKGEVQAILGRIAEAKKAFYARGPR